MFAELTINISSPLERTLLPVSNRMIEGSINFARERAALALYGAQCSGTKQRRGAADNPRLTPRFGFESPNGNS